MTELQSKLYRLNLQFFAEGASDNNNNTESSTSDDSDDNSDNDKDQTFTQSEVDSAISKAVDTAINNKRKEFEKEKEKAVADAKKDAKAYAKMTKAEQEEADYQKRLEDLEDRERQLNLKQLSTEVESDLKEEGLPTDFAASLVAMDDNEKIKESISNIKKVFDEAVNHAVKEKLRQDPPEGSQSFKERQSSSNRSRAEMARNARII
ncbi:DUF4355 domain-containing protein [Halobacillus sp. Nhm2S1]|uniref:DUF4355 domain-containing protein n=1 Tax=Halobacillus sp. Nhm2S1 TaxID=2866716 RepID=UPI001C7342E7|nr:DUF4355 domain-containing protein [Halobacillus sp. Nhm2S1]MBX0358927.1 DUF4355 domain-containing protein [Halobacillus sp. Nhm2S1]